MKILYRLKMALSYVTAIPGLQKPVSIDELTGLSKYLPLVGLIVGSVLVLVQFLADLSGSSPAVTAILIVIAWVAITGAIHLDGLMDTADGVLSHRSRERMLEIMRDSRTGNFGAVAGLLVILCKFAAIASSHGAALTLMLLLIPAWARWCQVLTIGCYPYARDEGMGKIWHDTTALPTDLLLALVAPLTVTMLACIFCAAPLPFAVLACAATVLSGCVASSYIGRHLGGQTGDTYGATVELAEAGGIVIASIAAPLVLP